MKPRRASCALVLLALAARGPVLAQSPPPAPEAAAPATGTRAASPLDELRSRIAGREEKPSEEVFRNIQTLKGVPAARLLRIMEFGYARSLGVECSHCHVPGAWEKDDKPQKRIAREMVRMTGVIVNEYLRKIPDINSAEPVVNCTTCHRGQVKPATSLPEKPRPAG